MIAFLHAIEPLVIGFGIGWFGSKLHYRVTKGRW